MFLVRDTIINSLEIKIYRKFNTQKKCWTYFAIKFYFIFEKQINQYYVRYCGFYYKNTKLQMFSKLGVIQLTVTLY